MNWPNVRERDLATKHYEGAAPSVGGLACLLADYRKELLQSFARLAVQWRLVGAQRGSLEWRDAREELLRLIRRLDGEATVSPEEIDASELCEVRARWREMARERGFSEESVAHFEAAVDAAVDLVTRGENSDEGAEKKT